MGDEVGAGLFVTAGGSVEPHRGDDGADDETLRLDLVGEGLDAVVGDIDIGVRVVEEEIDAIEFHAADIGFRGEIEHGVEADERLGAGEPLPTRPGQAALWSLGKLLAGILFWEGS